MTSPKNDAGLEVDRKTAPVVPGALMRAPRWATLTATFFGIGFLRPGPGTWGSAVTVVLWWLIARSIQQAYQPWSAGALALLVIAMGIAVATRVARAVAAKDPQFVVIDEVAGQLITLIAAPITWKCLLAAFILFRGFDIVKPPPVRSLERLPQGWGIVIDDVGAGLYALAAMQLLLHLGILHF
ncbi:MAG: phosphatidylglycerophosphatase A family protein [Terriglobales bacterium]